MKSVAQKPKTAYDLQVLIRQDEDGFYLANIPALRGCHTQAKDLNTLYKRLEEVASLCLEMEEKANLVNLSKQHFFGVQNIRVAV